MASAQEDAVSSRSTRWHQSTLSNLLDGCSWQYFLTYVLEMDQGIKPYATTGTAYHTAIELHENNRMANKETTLDEMLELAHSEIAKVIEDEKLLSELKTNCTAALTNWWTFHREWLLAFTPVAIEPEFTLPLVDTARPIGGYIDAVYLDPTTGIYFVVDHKTAKDFTRWRNTDGHRYQAAMYSAALVLSPEFPMITEMPEMVYMVSRTSQSTRSNFEHSKILRVQPDFEDVKMLGERIRAAEKLIETEAYRTKTDWPLCSAKWCPFFAGCQETGELSGPVAVVKARVRQQSQPALSILSQIESEPTVETTQPNDTEEV